MKDNITKAWERLEAGKGFNQRLDPPYYDMVDTNWEMFKGNQYVNSGTDDGLPRPVMDIIKRTITFFVASLTTAPSKVSFSQLAKRPGSNVDDIDMEVLNAEMDAICERIKLQSKIRDMYKDAAITGDFALHLYMDSNKKPYGGAYSEVEGEICCDVVDGNNVYFGNPNSIKTDEAQPYILITGRDMIKDLQEEYAEHNKDKTELASDNDNEYQAGNDAKIEIEDLEGNGKATYVIMYERKRDKKTKEYKIFVSKSIKDTVIYKDVDTGLTLYPVVWGNWERQKNNYHGLALCTTIIPNQIFINRMFAMAMKNLMDTAFPKAVYNADRISGWSNKIGTAIGIKGLQPGESVKSVADYLNTGTMSPQIIQMINLAWDYTKESLGVTDSLTGSVNPEQASGAAISVTAKQAAIPLTNPKNNMYDALESFGNIVLDMTSSLYGERPVIADSDTAEGEKTVVLYDFSRLKGVYLSTKVDVGAITPYDEMADRMTYESFLERGMVTFEEFIDAYPDLFKNKDKILARITAPPMLPPTEEPQTSAQDNGAQYEEMLASMPPDQQQAFMQLSPEEQQALADEYLQ